MEDPEDLDSLGLPFPASDWSESRVLVIVPLSAGAVAMFKCSEILRDKVNAGAD